MPSCLFFPPQEQAEGFLEESLLGGTVSLLCTALNRTLELRVVYTPASGDLCGRKCSLDPRFVTAFLDQPRRPQPGEYAPLPPEMLFFDLACAARHLPLESSNGPARAVDSNRSHGEEKSSERLILRWRSRTRHSMCGMASMSAMSRRGLSQAIEARQAGAAEAGSVLPGKADSDSGSMPMP